MKTITALALASLAFAMASRTAHAADFELGSRAIQQGGAIGAAHYWNNFGCSGGNVMPDLAWQGAPADTRSFAVTFYDKDAPTGSGFWHWVVYDIPADTRALAGGVNGGPLPSGAVEGHTDLGKPGYLGPCPPVGRQHTYVYTVHALKVDKLPVDKAATPALVGFLLWQNTLDKTSLSVLAGPR
ncbi:YbhB/YbcL family Raf kinase inhibitor-like protein [Variovorax terrae]|uniref:YbhB/YbcL family Raf kinase inhibitor-like protein n=1 Tax=Variovorax terrae TaxID=2923278 RepID=A0A9X1VWK2_9BURK|nr:YbhB/YbcL family Raf kinase inhibitor-like protein [Variovorax terrae]MCJ0765101.1 YbhB/YbcL family Raf kinase inhibitor-like protein [Variovorax terrae]